MVDDNVQFNPDRAERLRVELEGKIGKVDEKIDKKLPGNIFYWVVGIIIAPLIFGSFLYTFYVSDKLDKMDSRLTQLETKDKDSSK
jgi:hypothetical protein